MSYLESGDNLADRDIPDKIGPEKLEKLMNDLQIDDPVEYLQKNQEQAKTEGPEEHARWLLNRASTEVFREQTDIMIEHLLKYQVDVKQHGSRNEYNILTYIANQLRVKSRNKLGELRKFKLMSEYKNVY